MRYRILTSDDDYSFGNGQLDFYRDVPAAPGQAVKTRLLLFRGEWFLDTDEGTPYFEGVLGKHSIDLANATIQQRAIGSQGVVDIKNYVSDLNPDSRKLSVEFQVDTIYGPTQVDLQNYRDF